MANPKAATGQHLHRETGQILQLAHGQILQLAHAICAHTYMYTRTNAHTHAQSLYDLRLRLAYQRCLMHIVQHGPIKRENDALRSKLDDVLADNSYLADRCRLGPR